MKTLKEYLINEAKSLKLSQSCKNFLEEKEWLINIFKELGKKYIDLIPDNIDIEEYIASSKNMTLKDYRGYEGRFSWQSGWFDRYSSCWQTEDKDTIDKLKKSLEEENKEKDYNIIYSDSLYPTWCEYLESVGYDDPGHEWTVGDFRGAYISLVLILKEIKENQ